MFHFASPLKKSPGLRRRLALVLASAEDQIVRANVEEAITFLQFASSELSLEDALIIYFRMVGVPARIQQAVTINTLSRLNEEVGDEQLLDELPAEQPKGLRALARRLHGRRRDTLRQEIDERAARARRQLRQRYLTGAIQTVEAMRETLQPHDAVQLFIESLQIGEGWAELVYNEVVGREWGGVDGGIASVKGEDAGDLAGDTLEARDPDS